MANMGRAIADGAAVRDGQRSRALIADEQIGTVCPARARTVDRHHAVGAGMPTEGARGVADGAALGDNKRAVPMFGDIQVAAVGPGRAGSVDGRCAVPP